MGETMEDVERGRRDEAGARLGMWLFLITEIFLFAGLFLLYAVNRYRYPVGFHDAAAGLNMPLAAWNTAVLLTSSLSMALSIPAIKKGRKDLAVLFLSLTALLGVLFVLIKYFEWTAKIAHGLYPGSPELLTRERGEILFYGLYFFTTGLHGLHVIGGIVLLLVVIPLVKSGRIHQGDCVLLENSGLYWHLVDIIWIYLFPLFYLIA